MINCFILSYNNYIKKNKPFFLDILLIDLCYLGLFFQDDKIYIKFNFCVSYSNDIIVIKKYIDDGLINKSSFIKMKFFSNIQNEPF